MSGAPPVEITRSLTSAQFLALNQLIAPGNAPPEGVLSDEWIELVSRPGITYDRFVFIADVRRADGPRGKVGPVNVRVTVRVLVEKEVGSSPAPKQRWAVPAHYAQAVLAIVGTFDGEPGQTHRLDA